ncbi:dihydrodipicolinate synthase family protein [Arachnia propionica]|uniref:dihydrodipicolinate synthase family protein n=1 Tax=Arachnia propionica TaxID=1750 RepID=UPI000F6B5C9C|nr:dihydrodipicolinate synthase family protein [Arachnia propionica]VEJ59571.1 Dihydrodipicolinate synthase [Arachnia propionica]
MFKELNGVLTALVTPFDKDGAFDADTMRQVVDRNVDGGVDAVVAGGGTGEWAWLTEDERLTLFDVVIEQTAGRVPVIAQTGAMSASQAVKLSKAAERAGSDVIMLAAPYYEPLTLPEMIRYIKTVATSVDLPVMIYNNPGAFGMNLTADDIGKLGREVENIRYVKDSSKDWEQALHILRYHHEHIALIMGWDSFSFAALLEGAVGVMAGVANVIPEEFATVVRALRAGEINKARAEWHRIFPVVDTMVNIPFVQGVKAGMAMTGLPVGAPREPLAELPTDDAKRLAAALAGIGR